MNNLSMSVGTESNLATSSQYFEENQLKQEGGGIFSFLFDSEKGNYATYLALKAFDDRFPEISCYIIKDSLEKSSDVKLNYSKQNNNKRSLLHFIVYYCKEMPEFKNLLNKILTNTDAKQYINIQDSKGNTCAHYALNQELFDIVNLLEKNGADLSIRNNDGLYIKYESEPVKLEPNDIFVKITNSNSKKSNSNNKINNNVILNDSTEALNNRLANIVEKFVDINNKNVVSDINTINFTDAFTDAQIDSKSGTKSGTKSDTKSDLDTDGVITMLMREFKSNGQENTNNENKRSNSNYYVDNNSNIFEKIDQFGGAKKKNQNFFGKRKMITYSEMSFGGSNHSNSDSSYEINENFDDMDIMDSDFDSNSSLKGLARSVNNKATEAHTNSFLRIKEIMKTEDEDTRAIKAILYKEIKEKKPELVSNYDRALELEKMASDESILKSITKSAINKMKEKLKEKYSEKQNSSSDKKNKKKPRELSRAVPYNGDDSSSSSSNERMLERTKKLINLSDDSSTSSTSSD